MKHIYWCQEEKPEWLEDDIDGIAVVATSADEAKTISGMEYANDLLLDGDAREMPIGKVDPFEGLKRQIYTYIEGKCPGCDNPDKYAHLFWDEDSGKIYCPECPELQ